MGKTPLSNREEDIDRLLYELGSTGMLDKELGQDDLDRLLTTAPQIPVSAGFGQRAREAMTRAQSEREKRDPAIALGAVVGRARIQAGLGLAEAASRAGVPTRLLDALEIGHLSARQILRNLPPIAAIRLLTSIKLTVEEFTSRLMDLVASGGRMPAAATARVTDRRRQRDNRALVAEAAEYVAALKHLVQSDEGVG